MFSLARTALVLMVFVAASCGVSSPQDAATRIDAYLSRRAKEQGFRGAVLVAREGSILLSKGYGFADAENRVPNTPETQFRLHWMTMPFTAMAILMLQAEGRLDVQDPICRFILDCPEYWQGITIHHLLTHTSGMSDWVQPWDSTTGRPSSSLQLVAQIKGKPPDWKPGERLRYSNNGYIVLGHIIEQVSGESYGTFLQQRIFQPLGMENSGYDKDSNVAVGYTISGNPAPVPDLLFRYSASGLYSSVEDLYLWDQALYSERLIPQEYLDMMFTGYARTPSTDFPDSDYGYGWFTGTVLNRPVIAHGGGMAGFSSMMLRFPDERVTVIALRNYEMPAYDRLEIELAEMVFDEK